MRIAVVSDTHGSTHHTLNAVRLLDSLSVDAVLHCGDIGSPRIPTLFCSWPTHFVLGNVDRDELILREAIEQTAGHVLHGRFGDLELGGRRMALLHGDDVARLKQTLGQPAWDLVCCGHTHVFEDTQYPHTRLLNPGALYRARPHTLAIVDLATMEVTRIVL
jgi:uncharacterized protein